MYIVKTHIVTMLRHYYDVHCYDIVTAPNDTTTLLHILLRRSLLQRHLTALQ